MTRFMLDTDTCSYIIRERPASIYQRFQKLAMENICISIVTYAELMYGVERSSSTRINRPIIKDFVEHLDVLQWDVAAADQYAVIRTKLEAKGSPIGAMNMMIAANAISHEAVLVTNNQKHFTRIRGLKTENWV